MGLLGEKVIPVRGSFAQERGRMPSTGERVEGGA
jgi:hypothetical protein